MVKVRDLSDEQLDEQIEKYQKILDRLLSERLKRNPDTSQNDLTSEYHLKLDSDDLEEIERKKESLVATEETQEEVADEVGVTQILKLNKDLLDKE